MKSAGSSPVGSFAPPSVQETLQSPGEPLDRAARQFMEPRFGWDFSRVRVHSGSRAAQSARDVNALAYTVGQHVVFAEGRYEPQTPRGRHLLAHELAHTIQQTGASPWLARRPPIPEGLSGDERQMAEDALNEAALRREEARREARSKDTDQPPGGNMAQRPLSEADRKAIVARTGPAAGGSAAAAPATGDRRFVLHDTASPEPGAKRKGDLVRHGHTALGQGYLATVPASNPSVVSSTTFFERRRPTVTEDEQGDDVMKQAAREPLLRQAWQAADATARDAALDEALAKRPDLLPKSEEKLFAKELKQYRDNTVKQLTGTGKIFAGGYWSVDNLCARAAASGIASVIADAADPKDAKAVKDVSDRRNLFNSACQQLKPLFDRRSSLISSSAHVEIVEDAGSDCLGGRKAKKLPTPYTAQQYAEVERLYLLAALEAGKFPFITTHYFVQQAARNRCDPRCFDLGKLYQMIQKTLGHPAGTIYGLPTVYGGKFNGESIWWDPVTCDGMTQTTI
ncbi:eCIS core domain-containing protein [Sorangium sp. So ce131]|uniref:eCIS core domain-containing protein n=1 Tax=Sorangium sp. So ce131 TaxID=3133282 RepID=UPI003F605929